MSNPILLSFLFATASSTDALADLAAPRAEGFVPVIPVIGAVDVPTNPLILLRDNGVGELQLLDDGAAIADSTSTPATGHFSSLTRIIATDELRSDTHYRLTTVANDSELGSFTTGAAADNDAPAAPDVVADGSVLSIDSDETIEVVSVSVDGAAAYFDVLDQGTIIVDGEGVSTFSISALDRAGNSSAPVAVEVDLGRPAFFEACAAAPTTSLTSLLALLALLRRRR